MGRCFQGRLCLTHGVPDGERLVCWRQRSSVGERGKVLSIEKSRPWKSQDVWSGNDDNSLIFGGPWALGDEKRGLNRPTESRRWKGYVITERKARDHKGLGRWILPS